MLCFVFKKITNLIAWRSSVNNGTKEEVSNESFYTGKTSENKTNNHKNKKSLNPEIVTTATQILIELETLLEEAEEGKMVTKNEILTILPSIGSACRIIQKFEQFYSYHAWIGTITFYMSLGHFQSQETQ